MLGGSGRAGDDVEGLLRGGIASMSLGAAVIHAAVVPDHEGLPLHVAFFLVAAAVQSGLAAVVLRSRSGRRLALTAACNGAIAVIWVVSRTTGVPVEGAGAAEPIGFKDAISTLLEIGVVAGAGLVAVLPEASRRVRLGVNSRASTAMAACIWGLAVMGLVARHPHDVHMRLHDHDHSGALAIIDAAGGDESASQLIHRLHHPVLPGPDPDHNDHLAATYVTDRTVRRDRTHHHDVASGAFTDDGRVEPTHSHEGLPGAQADRHEHQPESESMDRSGGSGDGQDPGCPAGSAGRLIDDVMRLLESN